MPSIRLSILIALSLSLSALSAATAQAQGSPAAPGRISIDPPAGPLGLGDSEPPRPIPPGEERGISLGVRLGFGLPFGKAGDDQGTGALDMKRALHGVVPISLSVGFRLIPRLYIGTFFDYGFGISKSGPNTACPSEMSCSSSILRFGLDVQFHFRPLAAVDPWVGVGAGYEFFWLSTSENSLAFQGWELFNLQAGIDVRITRSLRIGPFAAFTLGRYDRASLSSSSPGGVPMASGVTPALHDWLMFGVRLQYTAQHPLD